MTRPYRSSQQRYSSGRRGSSARVSGRGGSRFRRNGTVFHTGLFPGKKTGVFRASATHDWFDRLMSVIEAAQEAGGVVFVLKKNIEGGSERPWILSIFPDDGEFPEAPRDGRRAPIRSAGDGAPEGDGDRDEVEVWDEQTAGTGSGS